MAIQKFILTSSVTPCSCHVTTRLFKQSINKNMGKVASSYHIGSNIERKYIMKNVYLSYEFQSRMCASSMFVSSGDVCPLV